MNSNVININSFKMSYEVSGDEFTTDLVKSFEKNFQLGQKNIAIASTHYHSLQQKLILLSLQYFNLNYPRLKIGVISYSHDAGIFGEFQSHATPTTKEGVVNFGNHFDIISWKIIEENKNINMISPIYDLIFWEIPEMEVLVNSSEELRSHLDTIQSLYIISHQLNTDDKIEFAKNINTYFLNHGVNISHVIPTGRKVKRKSA